MRWKLDLLLWPRDQETEIPGEACWLSQTQEGQTEQIHPQTFDDPFDSTGMVYMHWVPTGQIVNKEYCVEFLREFRKRFRRKWPALFKSAQWHFPTIWPRWASRQFLSLPSVKTLLTVTFGYPISSEAVVMRQLRRWNRLSEGHWHAHTRGLPWGLPEVVGTVQQGHCSRRRLLPRG